MRGIVWIMPKGIKPHLYRWIFSWAVGYNRLI